MRKPGKWLLTAAVVALLLFVAWFVGGQVFDDLIHPVRQALAHVRGDRAEYVFLLGRIESGTEAILLSHYDHHKHIAEVASGRLGAHGNRGVDLESFMDVHRPDFVFHVLDFDEGGIAEVKAEHVDHRVVAPCTGRGHVTDEFPEAEAQLALLSEGQAVDSDVNEVGLAQHCPIGLFAENDGEVAWRVRGRCRQ